MVVINMPVLGYTKFAKLKFFYRNKQAVEVCISIKDLKQYIGRIIEQSGILILQGKKIDLTFVEKITIDFVDTDLAII